MAKMVQLNAQVPEDLKAAFRKGLPAGKGWLSQRIIQALQLWLDEHGGNPQEAIAIAPANEEEVHAVRALLAIYRSRSTAKSLVELALKSDPVAWSVSSESHVADGTSQVKTVSPKEPKLRQVKRR